MENNILQKNWKINHFCILKTTHNTITGKIHTFTRDVKLMLFQTHYFSEVIPNPSYTLQMQCVSLKSHRNIYLLIRERERDPKRRSCRIRWSHMKLLLLILPPSHCQNLSLRDHSVPLELLDVKIRGFFIKMEYFVSWRGELWMRPSIAIWTHYFSEVIPKPSFTLQMQCVTVKPHRNIY